jgi:mono/diheme cytochrome c family protein
MSAPQPREFSHPILWTVGLFASASALVWVFFHYMDVGRSHGRDIGPVDFSSKTEVAKVVDHQALIADRSQAVLDRGQQLYLKNCGSCHGPNGDQNMTGVSPAPRNFKTEGYKAEWGGGPYGFFLTLTKGYGQGMPAFATLEASDRYAIAHFVRETWQKGSDRYVADDAPAIAAQIPKASAAAADGPRIAPHLVEQNARLHPLMQAVAENGSARIANARAWLSSVVVESAEKPLMARIIAVADRRPGWLLELESAAAAADHDRLMAILLAADSGDPELALAPATSVEAIATLLLRATAAPRT